MAKKNRRLLFTVILLLILGALIAMAIMKSKQKPKGTVVQTEKASLRTINETVSASGKIFPEKEVKISSDVSGEIVELYVSEGDSVVAGQLLAKIDPDAYISAVQRGKASVSSARSQLALSESQRQANIAQKEQIQAQLNNAKRILERNTQLKNEGVISIADYELSLTNVQNLEANLRAADANIKSAEQSIKSNEFSIESAKATLDELQTNLSRTTIKAPVDGIISSLSVEQGERVVGTIQMTGTEMMRIANLNSMEVQVDVSENDIIKVALNDRVEIEVDAYLDQNVTGYVTEIANSASNIASGTALNTDQVTNFIVKIRLNPESYQNLIKSTMQYPFRPGMSASVEIFTKEEKDIVSVPIQSVTVREKESDEEKSDEEEELLEVVFIAEADTVRMAEVQTGIQDDEYIQVLSGVEQDAEVISGPYSAIADKLEDGDNITIKNKEDKKKDSN